MKKILFAVAMMMATNVAFAHEYTVGDLVIDNPVVRSTPVNAPVSGGYMSITNNGDEADRLISANVEFAGETEIHEMSMDGDVMKMRELESGLEIPVGGTVSLQPGGFHLMFMKMEQQLKEGETHTATLTFEKAGSIEVMLNVESLSAIREALNASDDGMEMDHSKHGDMKKEMKSE